MNEAWNAFRSWLRSHHPCRGMSLEQIEAYLTKALSAEEQEAVERHLAKCPICRTQMVACFRANRSLAYLRMRVDAGAVRPELTLSPRLRGYGTLQISEAPARIRRYAASSHTAQHPLSQQSISHDGRLLVSLRQMRHRKWQLVARLVPHSRWHLRDNLPLLTTDPDDEEPAASSGLLCLLLRADTNALVARLGTPLVYDTTTGHYLAGFELPIHAHATPITIEYGLIPLHALRWLSPEEQEQSRACTLDLTSLPP